MILDKKNFFKNLFYVGMTTIHFEVDGSNRIRYYANWFETGTIPYCLQIIRVRN